MNERSYKQLCRSASSAVQLLQGKWRIPIFCALENGPVRLGGLMRLIPNASKKVISENLKLLEREGVLVRTDLSQALLHVEYDYSEEFRPLIPNALACLGQLGEGGLRARSTRQTSNSALLD